MEGLLFFTLGLLSTALRAVNTCFGSVHVDVREQPLGQGVLEAVAKGVIDQRVVTTGSRREGETPVCSMVDLALVRDSVQLSPSPLLSVLINHF